MNCCDDELDFPPVIGLKRIMHLQLGKECSGDVQQFCCVSYPFQQNVLAPVTKGLGAFAVKELS